MTFILGKESIVYTSITTAQKNQPEHMYAHAHPYRHCHHKKLQCTLFSLRFWYARSCHSYCRFCVALSGTILISLELNSLRSSIESQIFLPSAFLQLTSIFHANKSIFLEGKCFSQYAKEWQCFVCRENPALHPAALAVRRLCPLSHCTLSSATGCPDATGFSKPLF